MQNRKTVRGRWKGDRKDTYTSLKRTGQEKEYGRKGEKLGHIRRNSREMTHGNNKWTAGKGGTQRAHVYKTACPRVGRRIGDRESRLRAGHTQQAGVIENTAGYRVG